MSNSLLIVDLFSGAGGLSYGLTLAGFKTVSAVEHDKYAAATYKKNHPSVKVFDTSIVNVTGNQLKNGYDAINGVIGSPPCQAFSTLGNRDLKDPRAWLFKEYIRILTELSPQFFVFENVKGLLSIDNGHHFDIILNLLNDLGYTTSYALLNASEFGVPQHRKRVFVFGCKLGKLSFPSPTHGTIKSLLTVEDALSDMPNAVNNSTIIPYNTSPNNSLQAWYRSDSNGISQHILPEHGNKLINLIKKIKQGQSIKNVKNHHVKSYFPNSYGRLLWNKPSPTITRNLGSPSSANCIHPIEHRGLTSREGARLQTFPDSFEFCGNKGSVNLQIGNAVPPILAMAIGNHLKNNL